MWLFFIIVSIIIIITSVIIWSYFGKKSSKDGYTNNDESTNASRGFLATNPDLIVRDALKRPIYSLKDFSFLPCTTNVSPTLTKYGELLQNSGLFEVFQGTVYQVRIYDLGSITLIKTNKGFIMIDVLSVTQTCQAALDLITERLGKIKIHTVVITHSHIDHFGGFEAVLEYCNPDRPYVIAPADFFKASVQENVNAHNLLSTRSSFMYGSSIPRSCDGLVNTGLGLAIATGGIFSVPVPDLEISNTNPRAYTIDNLQIDFWYTPDAEAPSELMLYVSEYELLCASEILVHSLHNLYSPRGTRIRDGYKWSSYIDSVIMNYGHRVQCVIASHHWPIWGNKDIVPFLKNQRDIYRFIHDQTIKLADQGYSPETIAHILQPPKKLVDPVYNQSFYGKFRMNVRSQYALLFGLFNGNPAYLDPLPELEECQLFVEFGGGEDQCIQKAQHAIDIQQYQWAITILNKLVMNNPSNLNIRNMLASVYTTIAYQEDNAVWRNFYLTGATILAGNTVKIAQYQISATTMREYDLDELFLYLSTLIGVDKSQDLSVNAIFKFQDNGDESRCIELSNSVIFSRKDMMLCQTDCVDFICSTSRLPLFVLSYNPSLYPTLVKVGFIRIEGDKDKAAQFFSIFEPFHGDLSLVLPPSSSSINKTLPDASQITSDPQSLIPFLPVISVSQC